MAEAWPKAVNPINIFSGFRKIGGFPLNPGEVTNRYTAPAKVYKQSSVNVPDNLELRPLLISLVILVLVKQITVTMIHLPRG